MVFIKECLMLNASRSTSLPDIHLSLREVDPRFLQSFISRGNTAHRPEGYQDLGSSPFSNTCTNELTTIDIDICCLPSIFTSTPSAVVFQPSPAYVRFASECLALTYYAAFPPTGVSVREPVVGYGVHTRLMVVWEPARMCVGDPSVWPPPSPSQRQTMSHPLFVHMRLDKHVGRVGSHTALFLDDAAAESPALVFSQEV